MKAQILAYQVSAQKMTQLRKAAAPLHIAVREIRPEEIGQKAGCLAGVDGYERQEDIEKVVQCEKEEFLLMCHLSRVQFDLMMAAFQRKRIAPIAVKAMLTPTNQDWSFAELMHQVCLEHRKMHGKRV